MGCMEEIGKEEPDELERDGNKHVPEEGEQRTSGEPIYDHISRCVR